ncbi:MAG: TlpA family protein disulfide reductase [Bacteroidetes bacterium]|nr:TlpA family protein disulfide reductase [Bacteroidota bacterium]
MRRRTIAISYSLFVLAGLIIALANQPLVSVVIPILYIILVDVLLSREINIRLLWMLFGASIVCLLINIFAGAFLLNYTRFFISAVSYYSVSVYFLEKKKVPFHLSFLTVIAPAILMFTLTVFQKNILISWPILFAPLIAFFFVVVTVRSKKLILLSSCSLIAFVALAYVGYPNYIQAVFGKEQNNRDERVTLKLINQDNDTLNINSINAKVIVLDYWFTGCGVCYKKFPHLQELYLKYKDNKDVFIASVNIPFNSSRYDEYGNSQLKKYSFQKLKTLPAEQQRWNIESFPTILIFDKHKNLRYSGQLSPNEYIMVNNTYKLVEQLLNE